MSCKKVNQVVLRESNLAEVPSCLGRILEV